MGESSWVLSLVVHYILPDKVSSMECKSLFEFILVADKPLFTDVEVNSKYYAEFD